MWIIQPLVWTLIVFFLTACAGDKTPALEHSTFQVLFEKGRAYLERGNAPMALPALVQANVLQPDNPTLLAMLGLAYDSVGRSAQAVAVLEEARRLRPNEGSLSHNLGVAYLHVHSDCMLEQEKRCQAWLDKADLALEEALQDRLLRRPEEVWFNRALLYKRREYWRQMVVALEKSLEKRDDFLPARLELANFFHTMHRPELEKHHLRMALTAYPDEVAVLEPLADALLLPNGSPRDKVEARAYLERILSLAPDTDVARRASQRLLLLDKER